jgi:4-amino-4-deoxy-L-arabinose transferase-like glycosyltransferase
MSMPMAETRGPVDARIMNGIRLPERPSSVRDYLTPATLLVLSLMAVALVVRIVANTLYPYPLDNGEGVILGASWHAATGKDVYHAIDQPPYSFIIYGPILPYLGGFSMYLFGPTAVPIRLLSVFFYFGSAFVVSLFIKRVTGMWSASLVSGLFLITERHFFSRAAYAVTDLPAIFFSLLGLYLWRSAGARRYAAIISFALAFFSKQSAIVSAAAAFASLCLEGRRRKGVALFSVYIVVLCVGFAACWFAFGKAYFVNTFTYASVAPFVLGQATERVAYAAVLYFVPFMGLTVLVAMAFRDKHLLLPVLYTIFGLVAAFGSGREGASRSYFFDLAAGLSIMLGLLWPAAVACVRARIYSSLVYAIAALQAALLVVGMLYGVWRFGDHTQSDIRRDAAIQAAYREHPGMILSYDQGFCLGTNAENISTDVYKLSQLVQSGVISRDIFIAPIRNRQFSMIVLPRGSQPWLVMGGDLRREVWKHYRIDHENRSHTFLVPKPIGP